MECNGQNQSSSRDMVYCHQCENEWYRDEHGLTCPDCQSDFTEIIEPGHDPRNVEDEEDDDDDDGAEHPLRDHNPWEAPDPDEDDIGNINWQRGDDGYMHGNTRIRRNVTLEWPPRDGQAQQGQGGGLSGVVGGLLNQMLGNMAGAQLQQRHQAQQAQQAQQSGEQQRQSGFTPGSPQQEQRPDGTWSRHYAGPNYSFTISSTSSINGQPMGGGPGLFPRDANNPQPFQQQPDHLQQMLAQMMASIGAGPRFHNHGFAGRDEFEHDFPQAGPGPFGNILTLFGPMLAGGRHGDAVFSQEELDRVITQLMEQHQTGNAPGPASEQAIKSLPTREIVPQDLDTASGTADCSICMEATPVGTQVTVLPCTHWFHFECIEAWLKEHDTCPHCRRGIMPKDNSPETPTASRARQSSEAPLNNTHSPEFARPLGAHDQHPLTGQGSYGGGDGSASQPYVVPDSPTHTRATPARQGSAGSGLFRSMREAFGRRDSSGGGGQS
ncbi:hypothetical protein K431DRAFT_283182 [Polychaeton citri CBS 116435]|uniref:RING-type domain-containing protein n=1 Tax=Polychaeton citri CBS 116435 TaxID=1314669 RepID=A0A9P4QET3_9PEZI|nr:hypothetical protein K431DRAFT_283182 [Polychaeton citri CBS 116435]